MQSSVPVHGASQGPGVEGACMRLRWWPSTLHNSAQCDPGRQWIVRPETCTRCNEKPHSAGCELAAVVSMPRIEGPRLADPSAHRCNAAKEGVMLMGAAHVHAWWQCSGRKDGGWVHLQ